MTDGIREQKRIIRDPDDLENMKVPSMPLLVMPGDGTIWEAASIRGAAAVVIGNEYLDTDDGIVEWHMRVETARKEAMKALAADIDAVVFDSREGIIRYNYAAGRDDPDYQDDEDETAGVTARILVDTDRLFLLSLMDLGAIKVLERDDSYQLRTHPKWDLVSESKGAIRCCGTCLHKDEDNGDGESILCPVYNAIREKTDGSGCGSYSVDIGGAAAGRKSKTYVDIIQKYDINDLIRLFGQDRLS